MDYSPATPTKQLKFDVEYVLAHGGLFITYDESHWLIPQNYSAKTPPARMNWVRSRIIDRGMGVAFFSTRQNYQSSLGRFAKKTQYQFQQWIGRIAPPLILPDALDAEELLAAALAKFPSVDPDMLAIVVERCFARKTGFQELPGVVEYALFLADRAGRQDISLDDVDGAFGEFLGEPKATAAPSSPAPRADAAQTPRTSRQPVASPPRFLAQTTQPTTEIRSRQGLVEV